MIFSKITKVSTDNGEYCRVDYPDKASDIFIDEIAAEEISREYDAEIEATLDIGGYKK